MAVTFEIRAAASRFCRASGLRMLVVLAVAGLLFTLGVVALLAASPGVGAPGSAAVSGYQISKSVSAPGGWVRYGDAVTFTIRITNTGQTWITALPLQDVYAPAYLSYGHCGVRHTANPQPDDYADDGQLDWSDLTAAAPNGFGTDLAPGASFTVIVTFTAAADTTVLPGGATENRGLVHDALADPDGPGGPLPEEPLPDQASTAGIQVIVPT